MTRTVTRTVTVPGGPEWGPDRTGVGTGTERGPSGDGPQRTGTGPEWGTGLGNRWGTRPRTVPNARARSRTVSVNTVKR
ncbi:hypothetical protein TPA0906_34370 [Streptomyces olivaceus]|nr:hypothetical protein TPA0906_34370 [Streptomyces olivaceus]